MEDEKHLPIPQIMIIVGISISLIYLMYNSYANGDVNMDIASIVAICIALLSVAGGIWAQVVQFKLVDELNYQKKLKTEISTSISNKDYFVGNIEKLYEENAKLSSRVYHLEQELNIEKRKNIVLNEQLEQQNNNIHRNGHEHNLSL